MANQNLETENLSAELFEVRKELEKSRFPVAITGAGISVSSGIPLLSEKVQGIPLSEFFKPEFFQDEPEKYFEIYRTLVSQWRCATPNLAHIVLARAGVWVITQNIDGLHRDAGSTHLIELHGNLRELRCRECQLIFSNDLLFLSMIPKCPNCGRVLHPGVTLEGEEVRHYSRAVDWVGRADVLLVIGTKLNMYPVKKLVKLSQKRGIPTISVNDKAEQIVPEIFGNEIGGY